MKRKLVVGLCFVLVVLLRQEVSAQISINNIMGNKISNTEGYEGIEGNPYFAKEWGSGQVVFASGKEAKADFLRYDLVLDQLFFSDAGKENVFSFSEPVRAFTVRGAVFQNNFPAFGKFTNENYYQVIAKGKYSLLKKEENTIGERTAYGTPSVKYIKKNAKYYFYNGKDLQTIKTDPKSLADVLGAKKEDLEKYAKDNKLDFKNDAELKVIFENFAK